MINTQDVLETIQMIREENLDIRTITMGISLWDCVSEDTDRLCTKIYDKITRQAERLVSVGCAIEKKYGIPIVNKRVSVTPVSLIGGNATPEGYLKIAHTLQRAADTLGINFLGGFSALVQKGMTKGADAMISIIPEALAETQNICSSVNVASTKAGINMDAVARMGATIKRAAYLTRDAESIGCAKLVVFANVPEDNPFMAGAFCGIGEPEAAINVGVSGPGVVASAIRRAGDCDLSALAEVIKKTAFKITRVGQLVASEAAQALGVPESVIALTFVALGTSLPELVTAITSLAKGHGSLSLGNVIGANVFNLVLVSGMSITVSPFSIPQNSTIMGINSSLVMDLPVMFAVMLLLTVPALLKGRLSRWQGVLLLCIYAAFCAVQFTM